MQLLRGIGAMLALAAAACSAEDGRVRKRECEAVLAHLTALEKGESDQPMCKYHPDCGGDQAAKFERNCQKVLTQGQADCYLRATSLDDADDCLRRDRFDDALRTGRRKGGTASTSGDKDDPWFGGGSHDSSPLGQMREIKDDACACKDKDCADRVQQRFMTWAEDNKSLSMTGTDDITSLATEISECLVKAMTSGYGYGYYDAGVPDAYSYYRDPYAPKPTGTGMPACDEYFLLVDKLMTCSKYPASARQAMKDSVDSLRSGWGDPAYMSDYLKETTNESCRTMIDSMQSAMSAMGCP